MALACLFYLSFSLITRGVEKDARETADKYMMRQDVKDTIAKYAKGNKDSLKYYTERFRSKRETRYLDSMRRVVVWDIFIAKFTYEDCKEKEINLGLDLRGGMNVTLEVSVRDIIKGMSNKPDDAKLKLALDETIKRTRTDNRDFTVIFGEEMKKQDSQHPLSFYFRNINTKEITSQSTDEDVLNVLKRTVTQAINTAEQTLGARINRFGVSQPNIQKLGSSGRILIELPGISDKDRVRRLLQGTANLEFWDTWDANEVYPYFIDANDRLSKYLYPNADTAEARKDSLVKHAMDSMRVVLRNDSTKMAKNPPKTKADSDAVAKSNKLRDSLFQVSLTKLSPKDTAKVDSNEIKRRKYPFFQLTPQLNIGNDGKPLNWLPSSVLALVQLKDTAKFNYYLSIPEVRKAFPDNVKLMWANKFPKIQGKEYPELLELYAIQVKSKDGKAALYGDIITSANKTTDQKEGGNFSIEMSMNSDAAAKWKNITHDAMPQGGKPGRGIAIVLDDLVYSAPTVQNEIAGGNSQITGNFNSREAEDLANILSAGKLPAPAHIVEEQVVGPTLGAENIHAGFLSFAIAILLVLIFMVAYYNRAGLVADAALFVNMFFIMGVLASLGAVLTLPGIAGIVLTIGLSVDANILIFERIREELNSGKGLQLSINEGFRNAMSSIIDSNVTTLLLGLILYAYGTGPVQGFATTLIIGILTSLFSAIFISRLMFERMLKKKREITFWNSFTQHAFKKININFVGRRKLYYVFSSLIITLGVVFFFKHHGFNLGVDFKGGRSYVVKFDHDVVTQDVSNALRGPFEGAAPEVKTFGTDNAVKITTAYMISEQGNDIDKKVEDKLESGLKTLNNPYVISSSSKVGETISRDIRNSSFLTVLFSCVVMFFFILIRFKKWQYGLGATVALFHDVLVVLSCYTIFDGILPFTLEVNQDFIAAVLTVMAYSMTDTVVVFDRIREYLANNPKKDSNPEERKGLINYALNATLSRTINTSLTIFFVLLAIFIFGGDVIRGFAFALLIGIVIGTYSSICIATPVVVDLDRRKEEQPKA
jgi:SecD/SecF fusion protein